MPQVIVTERALLGLERCCYFLAARRAGQIIERQFALLEVNANIGRPLADLPELRELVIGFGDSGYVALYRYEPDHDTVYVLAFRHQKEAGYAA